MRVYGPGLGGWCMGIAEIAEQLGMRRQTVAQWHARAKLPPPDGQLAMGPVWRETTIEAWLATLGERAQSGDHDDRAGRP